MVVIETDNTRAEVSLEFKVADGGVLLGEPEKIIYGSTGMTVGVFQDGGLGVSQFVFSRWGFLVGDKVVIKWPDGEDSKFFATSGEKANESIREETAIDLRQEEAGMMPSSVGLVEVRKTKEGIMIFPANEDSAVVGMLMPYYSSRFGEMQEKKWSEELQENVIRRAIEKILAMQVEAQLPEDKSVVEITQGLVRVTLERALDWYIKEEDESYGDKTGRLLIEKLDELLDDEDFIEALESSGLKDCHGDPRLWDNGYFVVNGEMKIEPVIADPVRLWLKEEEQWSDYHITPEAFNIGLALARLYTDPEQGYLFEAGVEEYKVLKGIESEAEERLLNLGIVYGILVEILVQKNRVLEAGKELDDQMDGSPSINEYWEKINELVENNFMEGK